MSTKLNRHYTARANTTYVPKVTATSSRARTVDEALGRYPFFAHMDPYRRSKSIRVRAWPLAAPLFDSSSGEWIDNPTVLVAIDACTRIVLAYEVTLQTPTIDTLITCLSKCVLPTPQWQGGAHTFSNLFDAPTLLIIDDFPAFMNADFMYWCEVFAVALHYRNRNAWVHMHGDLHNFEDLRILVESACAVPASPIHDRTLSLEELQDCINQAILDYN